MARFSLNGKVYTTSAIDEVSLKDLVRFNTEAADMGLRERWNDIERVATEMDAMTPKEAEQHPDKLLVTAVTIWVARRVAGEDLSFGDAIDLPLSKITWIPDPEDKKPVKANPTKGPKRSVSAPADDQPEPVAE
jgi:hypothetical protein